MKRPVLELPTSYQPLSASGVVDGFAVELVSTFLVCFGDFARVHFQRYRPEDLQIKPRGLIPYRAEVNLDKAAYLEIPRVFIPGYRATVNGRQVPVEVSAEHLVTVRLEPGRNDVVVAYRGTVRLWIGFTISAATFLAGLVYAGGQVVCCIARGRVAALSA